MHLTIQLFDNCGLSPALNMMQRLQIELEERGFADYNNLLPMYNDPALVAYTGDSPCGAMVYRYDHVFSSWFILGSYVKPEWRLMGVHTKLFTTLVERAKLRGDITKINSGTHVDNLPSRRSQEKQGRRAVHIFYEYLLREYEEPKNPWVIKSEQK